MERFANGDQQTFSNRSDGQGSLLARVGEPAQKAASLHPPLGADALQDAEGFVLIDALDPYLHPISTRQVIENLHTTFPGIQLLCNIHSPYLIQPHPLR